jgi:protein O-GlcNAc transferase
LYLEHCRFGEKFEPDRSDAVPAHLNTRDPDRVLQVGLVSADLRNHAVASFFEPVFYLLLQMRGIHLHVYDNGRPADEVSRRMKAQSPNWIEVATMSVDALSQQIRRDRIDVLIDLSGHTPGHRLMNFAQKPAPVQMSWIGYPGTTGMRLMDYYIADPHFLPPGEFDAYFTEKILRLPANAPFQSIDHPPDVNPLPALTKGFICFGSFNRLDKISQEVVQLWAKLLCALPDARMVVGGMPLKGSLDQITDWFVQSGVEPAAADLLSTQQHARLPATAPPGGRLSGYFPLWRRHHHLPCSLHGRAHADDRRPDACCGVQPIYSVPCWDQGTVCCCQS